MCRPFLRFSLVLLFITLAGQGVKASHLVGGELLLEHDSAEWYTARLVIYFDDVNGNFAARDESALIGIFGKSGYTLQATLELLLVSEEFVVYTNPACEIAQLRTRKMVLEASFNYRDLGLADAEGFLLVWERCCRNRIITNLQDPEQTGQAYLLEVPPFEVDGEPLVNSSPQLFPPLADYACVNRPFFVDFGGEDPDGDSLVYTLVDPRTGPFNTPRPFPSPPPHPVVRYISGLSGVNPIPSLPGQRLKVSIDGLVTVTAQEAGLYVFAVEVKEYRNGELLGQVRRDFQLLVRDDCSFAEGPQLDLVLPSGEHYAEGDTVVLGLNDPRCFTLRITDPDAPERIQLQVRPVGFATTEPLDELLSTTAVVVQEEGGEVEVCLPQCPYTPEGYFVLEVLARDGTCATPLIDTLRWQIQQAPFVNVLPEISTSLTQDTVQVGFGDTLHFQVRAHDPDGDSVWLGWDSIRFDPAQLHMEFANTLGDSAVESSFFWAPDCDLLRLGTQDFYTLTFGAQDYDFCEEDTQPTVGPVVQVLPLENSTPDLALSSPTVPDWLPGERLEIALGDTLALLAEGADSDNHRLFLDLAPGQDSLVEALGLRFVPATGFGQVRSVLTYVGDCSQLPLGLPQVGPFSITFELSEDFCLFPGTDTVRVELQANSISVLEEPGRLPTIFTPNGDEYNPTFALPGLPADNCEVRFAEIQIVDRWGQEVFRSEDRAFGWAGAGRPDGVYFWIARYTNGATYRGTVTLYR